MDYPDILDENFYQKLLRKKEIREHKTNNRVSKFKKLEPQQFLLRNYISPVTPYNGLLVFHETGVGKTGAAISIAERFKEFLPTKIIVLVKSDTISKNFRNELSKYIFTGDNYATDDERKVLENGTKQEKIDTQKAISRRINKQYEIITYGAFINRTIGRRPTVKLGESVRSKKREIIGEPIKNVSNSLIIIDEAHNLAGNDGYRAVRTMLNKSINTKVVLLTATPAFDNVREIVEVINLILPKDQQLPDRMNKKNVNLFKITRLFDKKKAKEGEINSPITIPMLTEKGEKLLKRHVKGIVSYLKANKKTFPTQIVKGKELTTQKGSVKVVKCKLSDYQWKAVKLALSRDTVNSDSDNSRNSNKRNSSNRNSVNRNKASTSAIASTSARSARGTLQNEVIKASVAFKNTSDATSFVSPIVDTKGIGKYGKEVLKEIKKSREAQKELTGDSLKKYSAKLYKLIKNLEKIKGKGTAFVFSGFVEGGVNMIAEIMKLNGYSQYGVDDNKPKFALLSGKIEPARRERFRKMFNKSDNKKGSKIAVLLATPVFSEGITLKNVRQIHILEPAWNMSRLIQVEGRGIRNNSHIDLLPKNRTVETYKYCAVAPKSAGNIDTIDEVKYKVAEKKDRSIKKAERILKKAAIDCALNKNRNRMDTDYENTSKCDYTNCNYQCDSGPIPPASEEDISTWYFSVTKRELVLAKKMIKDLFKISSFWNIESIYGELKTNAGVSKDAIAIALQEIINKQETFTDQYDRDGYLIYRKNYYIFQPDDLQLDASIFQRNKPPVKMPNMNLKRYLLQNKPNSRNSITSTSSSSSSNSNRSSSNRFSPNRSKASTSKARNSTSKGKSPKKPTSRKSPQFTIDQLNKETVKKVIKNSIYATLFNRKGIYDGKFRIVDNRSVKANGDTRKIKSGQACTTIRPPLLKEIINLLNKSDPKGILSELVKKIPKEKVSTAKLCNSLKLYFNEYNLILKRD